MDGRWEHFHHEADVGVRGLGATREEAFAQGALALTAAITEPALVSAQSPVTIECSESDDALLFTDWLNALIYEMATRRMLFSRFEVRIEGGRLAATAWGEPVDTRKHHPAVEAKGATYTELDVRRQPDGTWLAQCVVDV